MGDQEVIHQTLHRAIVPHMARFFRGGLAVFFLTVGACSTLPGAGIFTGSTQGPGISAGPSFFGPEEPQLGPKPLPVNRPVQVTFEGDPLLYAALSPSGRHLAFVSLRGGSSGLWLQSLDPGDASPPRRLVSGMGDLSDPAFSPDGRRIAFAATGYDVKGDIYVLDLDKSGTPPRRLTGRETEEGSPSFSPDGKTLYFHQSFPAEPRPHLAALDLQRGRPEPLGTGGDGAFPALSPGGRYCAFVSFRDDPGGDIFVLSLETREVFPLTRGGGRDLFPAWSRNGKYVYFSRLGLDTNQDGEITLEDNPVIYRVAVERHEDLAFPVTSGSHSAYQPMPTASGLYFLSSRAGGGNLWALPLEGEIPERTSAKAQMDLVRELDSQVPADDHLTVLACYRVLENFWSRGPVAAEAALFMGRLYEDMQMEDAARQSFRLVERSFSGIQPQAALCRISLIKGAARLRWGRAVESEERQAILEEALTKLEALCARHPENPRIQGRSRIEQARLLAELGKAPGSLLESVRILERVIGDAASPRFQKAEAMVVKTDLFGRVGRIQDVVPGYIDVIKQFPDVGEWSDRAVDRVLGQSLTDSGLAGSQDQIRLLKRLARKYQESVPRVAMGAWNRVGDICFEADEWAKAKGAYRHVLEQFQGIFSQRTAAAMALAEVLYREERFRQALDLYEEEMALRPYEDRLYHLARRAYVRKSMASGEFLFRMGEVPSAKKIFLTLIREDYSLVEAHRGYIKCAAAQKKLPETLARYRERLAQEPDDPVTLYAMGLCLTYVGGEQALTRARSFIERAIERRGQIAFFHQTMGYILEVMETVYGKPGQLEAALECYRKAYFLNNPQTHPENAVHLCLNLGNSHFLLGQYGKAFEYYTRRFESGVPFDQEETEILFYRRFGVAAFQVRERQRPIQAYRKALDLIEKRMEPKRASKVYGTLNRYILDRVIRPVLHEPGSPERAQRLAQRQAELDRRVAAISEGLVGPPPDPAWKAYSRGMEVLLSEQEGLIDDLRPLMGDDREATIETLRYMAARVRDALEFPPRLMHLKAEMLGRLGLAFQEAEDWHSARKCFERVFEFDDRLGLQKNLAASQRAIAFNTYMEAGDRRGQRRVDLLRKAAEGFEGVLALVDRYGVAKKAKGQGGEGLLSLALDVSLDEEGATHAVYGFSSEQEKRIAEAFLSRIQTELGELKPARKVLDKQTARYPPQAAIEGKDKYGVSLLFHRSGHVSYARQAPLEAFCDFERSATLSLELENPVSAAINVINMGQALLRMPQEAREKDNRVGRFRSLARETTALLKRFSDVLDRRTMLSFHNTMGVFALVHAQDQDTRGAAGLALRAKELQEGALHFLRGLAGLKGKAPVKAREVLALGAALNLNMARVALWWGEKARAEAYYHDALMLAREGLLSSYEWRALAGLGRLGEALEVLQSVSFLEAGCGPGEITVTFSPLVGESLRAGEVERAFNLVERLSELERVHRLVPLIVRPLSRDERAFCHRIAQRLLVIQDLKRALKTAEGEEKVHLARRLTQEESLINRAKEKKRGEMPSIMRLAGNQAEEERLLILLGLAAHAQEVAEAYASRDAGPDKAALEETHKDLMTAYTRTLKGDGRGSRGGGILEVLRPNPVEAIDVMESLPEGIPCVRLFALAQGKKGWVAFILTPQEIRVESFYPRSGYESGGPSILVYEDPRRIPGGKGGPFALSGSHLVRCIENRRPFKQRLVVFPSRDLVPKDFSLRNLAETSSGTEIVQALPEAQTFLLDRPVYRAASVPTRAGERPRPFMAFDLHGEKPFPLVFVAEACSNVSLALLPRTPLGRIYPVAHLMALFGVPSLLCPRSANDGGLFLESFLRHYGSLSAGEALRAAQSTTEEGWVQVGYWGMTPEKARLFARKQFSRYVRTGVASFKENRFRQALILFENALRVAEEVEEFGRYRADLHRSARESAYSAGDLQRAAEHALALVEILAQTRPDSEAHGEALLKRGLIEAQAQHYGKAVADIKEAVEIMAGLELAPQQVEALSSLGVVLESATDYDRALTQFQSAASLSKESHKREILAQQYENMGRIYDLRLSRYARGLETYTQAFKIYEEMGLKAKMARSLLDMGRCHRFLGNLEKAEDHYYRALDLVQEGNLEDRLRAKIMIEQANNAWYQARYQEAFRMQRKVYDLAEEHGWTLEKVMALNTSGLIWWTLGDSERALRELDAALDLAGTLSGRSDEVATTLNNMGLVYRKLGRFEKALEVLEEALRIDRRINSRWAIAYDLRNKGLTLLRMGRPDDAIPLFEEALPIAAVIGNRINQSKTLLALGEALSMGDRVEEATGRLKEALAFSRSMALREVEWRALFGLARLRLRQGEKAEAKALLFSAVEVIEGMRAEIRLEQLKDGFIADKMEVYETLIPLLLDLGETESAFDMAERSRARNLIDLLGNQRLNLRGVMDQRLYDRMRALKARAREQERLLAQADTEAEKSVYGPALRRVQDQYRDLMLEIQESNPELATLVSVDPLTLSEIQEHLDSGIALLAYYVVPQEVLCWLVGPQSVELFRIPVDRELLGRTVLDYRRKIQNLEPLEKQSRELHEWLLSMPLSQAGSLRALGIIPHGTLHYLSFSTLYDGKAYLVERYPLFYMPGASVLRYTLQRRKAGKNLRVLAIANPDLGNPTLDLPFTEHEVASIGWNFPDITVLTGERATESWVVDHVSEFGIIHLASHGEYDPINPLFSEVKLVKDSKADGDLEAAEVFGLRIEADLVLLSACQTGLGKVTKGDDVIGMNRAFLYAGTHAIISSLWRVSDISTALLVKHFYREYIRANKSESLRKACLHVKNRYPHPGYWGGFVLVGDYD